MTVLLERAGELAALEAFLDAATNGDGHLVVVEGVAGIGKTRLLTEARALARSRQLEVLTARGGERENEFAFGIVRQLFEPALATAVPKARAELLSGAAELAAPLVTPDAVDMTATVETSFAILHGLYWLAANLAFRGPLLLVVDDLHWADDPSLRWLGYLARRLEGLPLLLLGATRPLEQVRDPQLLAELVGDPSATVIRPEALGEESTKVITRDSLGVDPDQVFSNALQAASGGNPLYLAALLDTVKRVGMRPTAEEAPRVLELEPQAVSRAVALALGRLTPEAAELVRAAAVLGDGAHLKRAAELAGLDPVVASIASRALVGADFLRTADPIEFVHPVVRAAVCESLDPGDCSDAHRRAAEILLESGAPIEQAAGHLMRTIATTDPFATSTLRQAAARSLAQGAADSAVVYLRRAFEQCTPEERADVLWETGVAERRIDDAAAIEHLRQALELTALPGRRAAISLDLSQVLLWVGGHPKDAIEVAQAALADPGGDDDVRAGLTANLVAGAFFDPELYPLAVATLDHFRAEDLRDGLGRDCLLAFLAEREMRTGRDRRRAVELAESALASGRLAHEGQLALVSATLALLTAGEADAAAAAAEAGAAEARRSGDLSRAVAFTDLRAYVSLERGDLLRAEQDAAEALELGHLHEMWQMIPYAATWAIETAIEQGSIDAASRLQADLGAVDATRSAPNAIYVLQARGKLRAAERRPDDALANFLAEGRIATSIGIENPAHRPWRSHAALALHQLGRTDEARELALQELQSSRRWGAPRAIGVSLRALGLLQGGDEAIQLLREAVEVLAGSFARLEHARALVDLGAALRRDNRRSEARKHLRDGIELALVCGAQALVTQGNDELAATGAHRRAVLLTGLEALTASERRVAQLAADGLSNKEIAQTLFVTVKTVEVHLSRVYRKLGIGARNQLQTALGQDARHAAPRHATP